MVTKTSSSKDSGGAQQSDCVRIRWNERGMRVMGVLTSIDEVPAVYSRTCREATVETVEGLVKFYLTMELEGKLPRELIGGYADIIYLGETQISSAKWKKNFDVQTVEAEKTKKAR